MLQPAQLLTSVTLQDLHCPSPVVQPLRWSLPLAVYRAPARRLEFAAQLTLWIEVPPLRCWCPQKPAPAAADAAG